MLTRSYQQPFLGMSALPALTMPRQECPDAYFEGYLRRSQLEGMDVRGDHR